MLQSVDSRSVGFSRCSTWAPQLWLTGSVAPWHVGSSLTGIKPVSAALAGRFLDQPGSPNPGNLGLGPSLIYHWSLGAAEKQE